MPTNFEFKAKAANISSLQQLLAPLKPQFIGEDNQVDTYFNVKEGRLKLREGNIENFLIHYNRSNLHGAKLSEVLLFKHTKEKNLKEILTAALGIKVIVSKKRLIYFVENVKFHFDEVCGLGTFVEVEAIDTDGTINRETLQQQCEKYARLFNVKQEDYVATSYSDLLILQKAQLLSN